MTGPVTFFVAGTPRPQGSKVHVGGGKMRESSKHLPAWRAAMTAEAKKTGATFPGAVSVQAEFLMPRTKAMKPDSPLTHTAAPDLDKLLRALGDALTDSGLVADDRFIGSFKAAKRRAAENEEPGVRVVVLPLDTTQPAPVPTSGAVAVAGSEDDDARPMVVAARSGDQRLAMIALRDHLAEKLETAEDARATAALAARFAEALERIDSLGGVADMEGSTPLAAAMTATGGDR